MNLKQRRKRTSFYEILDAVKAKLNETKSNTKRLNETKYLLTSECNRTEKHSHILFHNPFLRDVGPTVSAE